MYILARREGEERHRERERSVPEVLAYSVSRIPNDNSATGTHNNLIELPWSSHFRTGGM